MVSRSSKQMVFEARENLKTKCFSSLTKKHFGTIRALDKVGPSAFGPSAAAAYSHKTKRTLK